MPTTKILDLTGLKCPLPVLLARKSLATMSAGDMLELVCTDPMAAIDIPTLVQETGDSVDTHLTDRGTMVFRIRKLSI